MSQQGFTLLEAAVVIAITAILLAVAVPSYHNLLQRQQLRLAGEALAQDMRMARELSIRENTTVYISYKPGKQWCWGLSRGQACDCAAQVCSISRMDQEHFPHVLLDIAQDAAFSAGRGQVEQFGDAAFRTERGQHLRVSLNAMGRARLCGRDAPERQSC
ncbi:prepilin-type N-terminal cleavage/methylation domain-containing protein [Paucibacter oligotrophus]|uniref:Type II secretion system protein H n=1 Tax=Roseateles oligotrophus TaxID=1769250 RepID=A0A840LBI7_9BURK|nr:prepilin-type N-terminal cleavage/methylation domain-containing protein [Roseateles oligotrophus]MBB4843558.1 prepilin-type N-terminal cleavage/methylation domain-containing protein [Roseateles oligotrophus]